jgi:hypothetical protein
MLANGALLLGLTLGLAPQVDRLLPALPFAFARGNFWRAAQQGLDAEMLWPHSSAPSPRPVPAVELIERLLPVAREGLVGAGVEADEADAMLSVVQGRLKARRTERAGSGSCSLAWSTACPGRMPSPPCSSATWRVPPPAARCMSGRSTSL